MPISAERMATKILTMLNIGLWEMKYGVLGKNLLGYCTVSLPLDTDDRYRQVEQDTMEHYAKKAHQWAKGSFQDTA